MSDTLIPLQGEELLERVDSLIERIGENFFELGQHLFEIKSLEVYRDRKHDSWKEYCDAALPFQYRKADHYIELWELYCQKLGFDYEEIKHVGWSKLVKVKGLISNRTDAKKWIKKCETHGRRAIETLVKREHERRRFEENDTIDPVTYDHVSHDTEGELEGVHSDSELPAVDPGVLRHEELEILDQETGERIPLHQFQVYLFQPQWVNVMAAMNRAGQLANSDKPGHLLDLMADEFNSTYVETADGGVAQNLEKRVAELERIFEVKLTVDVPDDSRLRKMSRLDGKKKARGPRL